MNVEWENDKPVSPLYHLMLGEGEKVRERRYSWEKMWG